MSCHAALRLALRKSDAAGHLVYIPLNLELQKTLPEHLPDKKCTGSDVMNCMKRVSEADECTL